MKISVEWLSQYLPGPLDAKELGERLTMAGLPVEHFEQHGDDTVFDVEVTSNRGDCLSHIGVARELAALLGRKVTLPAVKVKNSSTPVSSATSVMIDALALCPHYTARVIKNVKIGPSPAWMVRRLEALGLRSINNVADITNYVMYEMGQPLHAFDYDKLDGHKIIVRTAKKGETIMSIDGKKRELAESMLVIADASKPVAIAGVMGGLESEVSAKTVNILLESAMFEPLSVRKTARSLTMMSDASYRFERRVDPTLPHRASLRCAQLICEIAGGELYDGAAEAGSQNYTPKTLELRLDRLKRLLGIDIPAPQVMDAFARLELQPIHKGNAIQVSVPSWRLDINIETDLIEEAARIVGYDKIPIRDEINIRLTPPNAEKSTLDEIRNVLTGSGFYEALTVSFVSDSLAKDFMPIGAAGLIRADLSVRKGDGRLRPSVIPGLLEAVRYNQTVGNNDAMLFEIGPAFWLKADGNIDEHRKVALVGTADYRQIRGAVESLLNCLDPHRVVEISATRQPGFANGACGQILWSGELVGHIGKVDRAICDKVSLKEPLCAVELELSALLSGARPVRQLKPLPRFPSVDRDLSLVVAESVEYASIEKTIAALNLPDLESTQYVTTYRGKPLEKGSKSISLRLIFRSATTTLTSAQVEDSVKKAADACKEKLSAVQRA